MKRKRLDDVRRRDPTFAELQAVKRVTQERAYARIRNGTATYEQMLLLSAARIRRARVKWPTDLS